MGEDEATTIRMLRHIGLIADGNGRWAAQRKMPRSYGHYMGIFRFLPLLERCYELGVEVVSGYVWSRYNWARPAEEIQQFMHYIEMGAPAVAGALHTANVQINHLGSVEGLPPGVATVIRDATTRTRHNTAGVFNILINYSGRAEITDAVRRFLMQQPQTTQIIEEALPTYLQVPDLPDVDLIIRAGGEYRTSDFLVWQSAHAVVYVRPKLWPELEPADVDAGITYYQTVMQEVAHGAESGG